MDEVKCKREKALDAALLTGPSQAHLGAQGRPAPAAGLPVVRRSYPPAQPPPPDLHITSLHDDARDEYVAITNAGGSAQELTGWRLYSAVAGIPAGYVLGVGVGAGCGRRPAGGTCFGARRTCGTTRGTDQSNEIELGDVIAKT